MGTDHPTRRAKDEHVTSAITEVWTAAQAHRDGSLSLERLAWVLMTASSRLASSADPAVAEQVQAAFHEVERLQVASIEADRRPTSSETAAGQQVVDELLAALLPPGCA
jgi:hypothetical protein